MVFYDSALIAYRTVCNAGHPAHRTRFPPQVIGMKELLACQASNDQDANAALSLTLNKQLVEAKSKNKEDFVAAMFRASAFLVSSEGDYKHTVFSQKTSLR